MDTNDILTGRKLVEKYEGNLVKAKKAKHILTTTLHSEYADVLTKELQEIGFESIADFYEQNRLACVNEAKRCFVLDGECDACIGREKGCYQPCSVDKPNSVGYSPTHEIDFYKWQKFEGNHAPNCKFFWKQIDEPKFDIHWRMPEGVEPEVHFRAMRRFYGNLNT